MTQVDSMKGLRPLRPRSGLSCLLKTPGLATGISSVRESSYSVPSTLSTPCRVALSILVDTLSCICHLQASPAH